MLKLIVLGDELYDELTDEFSTVGDVTLELEHSLLSLSKWEAKFEKPFLSTYDKTNEETLAYVEFMILDEDYPEGITQRLSKKNMEEINEYIGSRQSATTFNEDKSSRNRGRSEIITSELIYYWMVAATIPFECESWNLNRLFNLVQIYGIKNSKQKNMPKADLAARNRALNAQRKAQLGTTG